MSVLLRGCCTLVLLAACAGKPPQVDGPKTSDVEPTGVPDASTADPTGAGTASSAAGASSTAAATPAPTAPAPLSCIAFGACTEMTLGGKEAADAKSRCKAASGQALDVACSHDDVIATCALTTKNATLYHYKATDPEETRGRLKGAESGCKAGGGTFALAAKPAAAKPSKPGATPKTPAKKP